MTRQELTAKLAMLDDRAIKEVGDFVDRRLPAMQAGAIAALSANELELCKRHGTDPLEFAKFKRDRAQGKPLV